MGPGKIGSAQVGLQLRVAGAEVSSGKHNLPDLAGSGCVAVIVEPCIQQLGVKVVRVYIAELVAKWVAEFQVSTRANLFAEPGTTPRTAQP